MVTCEVVQKLARKKLFDTSRIAIDLAWLALVRHLEAKALLIDWRSTSRSIG
jgi:hypothetical protein